MNDVIEEPKHKQRFVWVKDRAGNQYVCRIEDLQNPKNVTDEDLKNCIDDASRAIPIGDQRDLIILKAHTKLIGATDL